MINARLGELAGFHKDTGQLELGVEGFQREVFELRIKG